MGRTVTLSGVRERIRTAYDLPSFSTTTWVTTAAVNSMINESLQSYFGFLVGCFGDNYFADSTTLTTVADTGTSALPADCHKVLALHWVRGTDDVVKLRRGTVDDLKLAGYSSQSWHDYCPSYRLGTSTVQWLPKPSAAYSVLLDYVALPADLSADGDTFEAGNGWETWVIADVCAKLAAREEKDPSVWFAERADAERRIRAQAPERDEGDGACPRPAAA
jgi:hypothetical protein